MAPLPTANLRRSAGFGLLWGAGFTLLRDVVQFATMLFLVRLLSPEVYGEAALAQTILLFLSVLSLKSLVPFALSARDPQAFDWSAQFSAGAIVNVITFFVSLAVAAGIAAVGGKQMEVVAKVLATMALIFPLEILATHQFTVLQAFHRWKRMRLLLMAGTLGGAALSVALAFLGAGVFALAVGNLVFSLPLLADFFLDRARPRVLPLRRPRRETLAFGANRAAAGGLKEGATLAEQSILTRLFGFALLGTYTRAIGLAQLTSGRIGPTVTAALFPVLTRAQASSERFRRFAHLLLTGVVWTSVPAAVFLACEADAFVALLYGPKWSAVTPLMPYAAALLALRGLYLTLRDVLVANLQQRASLRIDLLAALTLIGVALTTPAFGMRVFLAAFILQTGAMMVTAATVAVHGGALAFADLVRPTIVGILAGALGASAIVPLPPVEASPVGPAAIAALLLRAIVFSVVVVAVLRIGAKATLALLLEALPLPSRLGRLLRRILVLPR
ncbi:polysaccharide biosynthesis protein [Stappia sp. 22II-S9-Z10]|nr:polysaccharide biosynthesis protein [Stappia sp. 22II-S9-Z10]